MSDTRRQEIFSAAISVYRDGLAHSGTNVNVMSSIDECSLKMGRTSEDVAI